jgi:glutamyl-Q tRNA(Asp) synthetase
VPIVTRFAPSPNGPLHLGHAYSAMIAHDLAEEAGGAFLVRIEDIDGARSRPEWVEEHLADLAWLGLESDRPVIRQSQRIATYDAALERLKRDGLLYPCRCTRTEIADAASEEGPEGPVYPGICKNRTIPADRPWAWRLDMEAALERTGSLGWEDAVAGHTVARPERFGDVVLARKDAPASYHLAATLDDAAQGVTLVTRGADLLDATDIHRLLIELLGLPVPRWHHHALLIEPDGRKLAKRRGSGEEGFGLADRRRAGEDGQAVAAMLRSGEFPAGITLSQPLSGAP